MLTDFLDLCIKEVNKPDNKKKINEEVIEPLVSVVLEQIRPFAIGAIIFLFITISLMLCILFIIIFK